MSVLVKFLYCVLLTTSGQFPLKHGPASSLKKKRRDNLANELSSEVNYLPFYFPPSPFTVVANFAMHKRQQHTLPRVGPASSSPSTAARNRGRTNVLTAIRNKLRRNRGVSMDCDNTEMTIQDKCATLPARMVPHGDKPRTLHWMAGMIGEMEGSLNPNEQGSSSVTREDSEESVDSGFHQHIAKVDDSSGEIPPPPPPHRHKSFYDVESVQRAFGPMKDVGRWYSSYNFVSRQGDEEENRYVSEESRYVNRPQRIQRQLEMEEDERLASRPLPPIPAPGEPPSKSVMPSQEETHSISVSGGGIPEGSDVGEGLYEFVEHRMMGSIELTLGLRNLAQHGWYWGPITRVEAEERLNRQNDGTFLVRDSSDDRYLLSLSFRSQGKTLHTRIEFCNGHFSFYSFPDSESEGYTTVVQLIEKSMEYSQNGVFCFSRARALGSPAVPVRLLKPFSRFKHVRSLQHYCRFVIRQNIRFDMIRQLPLPRHVHGFLEQSQF